MIHDTILTTVGNTPIVRINRLAPRGVNLFAKVEAFNPLGSVKDRLAVALIEDAEARGLLKRGQTVVEATNGNAGIGLAMVCAARNYRLVIVIPRGYSVERCKLMRFLGAKVIFTPAEKRISGAIRKAQALAEKRGWFLCEQYENEVNAEVHARDTAREIVAEFTDRRLDHFVTGYGTGGTLAGISRVLRDKSPGTRIVVCEPADAAMLSAARRANSHNAKIPDCESAFMPHNIQGWTPDFLPQLIRNCDASDLYDEVMISSDEDAVHWSRELARKEGIFVGISAGATFSCALAVARQVKRGDNVLCMFPDSGNRYLSTRLFSHISEEMNDEELRIAGSA